MLRSLIVAALAIAVQIANFAAMAGAPPPSNLFPKAAVVKVYMFQAEPKGDMGIMPDFATLDATAVPAKGVTLTAAQVGRVQRTFAVATGDQAIGACFVPRHGFVFEDANGKVIGTLDVCFECSNYSISAPGYEERAKTIYDRHKQPDGDWDEKIARKQQAEIDRLRAEYDMPPTEAPIDWKGLAALVQEAGMPPAPKPADYERVGKAN